MIESVPSATQTHASRYATLPDEFYARVAPTPVAAPKILRFNRDLARELGVSAGWFETPDGVAALAGNRPFEGVEPIAMAYAGHQFGNFVPSLGDGRAHQIGEVVDRSGNAFAIQLKGSGPTPFSRRGDGRAALGPVLREYVVSEAMSALGIPTTRALAMVTTGEQVHRERAEPGAILTRVSAGFVRVGTFEFFAARGMQDSVKALADHVIERAYPDAATETNAYVSLLDRVVEAQADLIARWMLVGFIHGVMNTDNMSIMGETIDYGPCAFLDEHEPSKVFSSIDQLGRYAYSQQPGIGLWNLTRFAETLLPLFSRVEEDAIEIARVSLARYASSFQRFHGEGLLRKLGLSDPTDANHEVAKGLLEAMAASRADHTVTFRRLGETRREDRASDIAIRALFDEPEAFDAWAVRWRERLEVEGRDDAERSASMQAVNPLFIPRNHRIQQAIDAAIQNDDLGPLDDVIAVTSRPFEEDAQRSAYATPPEAHEVVRQTFCGT